MVEPVRTASAVEDGTGAPAESTRGAADRVPARQCLGSFAVRRVVEPGTHLSS
jgi:hypothetical protein